MMQDRGVPRTGFWNGTKTLKQYFVLPKNGSKYYLKYTFLVFPVLGVLSLGTPLMPDTNELVGEDLCIIISFDEPIALAGSRLW